jgi:GNAT superfamily N-acetyltransferase
MIRDACRKDVPRLLQIRNAVLENAPRDPSSISARAYAWYVDHLGIFVWEEDNEIIGFSSADLRDGSIWALFMDAAHEGRGIARRLFEHACAALISAGWRRMWLTTQPGSRAEQFYRKAGWVVTGTRNGDLVLERILVGGHASADRETAVL